MAKITAPMLAALQLIAADTRGFAFMSQAEGKAIVDAGLATVDPTNVDGDKAAVALTAEGREAVGAPAIVAPVEAPAKGFEIDTDVALPTDTVRRQRDGGYPFGKLEVGQSFHVAKTEKNPDPATRLQSSVSAARVSFSVETGESETVTQKTYKKGADGTGFAKDEAGKRIVESTNEVTRPKLKVTRDFVVKAVGADDARGEGARVWRTA